MKVYYQSRIDKHKNEKLCFISNCVKATLYNGLTL